MSVIVWKKEAAELAMKLFITSREVDVVIEEDHSTRVVSLIAKKE